MLLLYISKYFRVSLRFKIRNITSSSMEGTTIVLNDSTIPVLEDALKSNTLSEVDVAELEHFLYERPAFELAQQPEPSALDASSATEISILAHGKRGLTHGTIRLLDGGSQTTDIIPRLSWTFSVTVNPSLELFTFDIAPIDFTPETRDAERHESVNSAQEACFYLLILEFRNAWLRPLELSLKPIDSSATKRRFQSGQVQRIGMILPRLVLPSQIVEQSLPRRQPGRQFLAATAYSSSNFAATREAWWYRQQILSSISGTWLEDEPNGHSGRVELRGLGLNEAQLQTVKRRTVEVSAQITAISDPIAFEQGMCHRLAVKVQNNGGDLPSRLSLMCRVRNEMHFIPGSSFN